MGKAGILSAGAAMKAKSYWCVQWAERGPDGLLTGRTFWCYTEDLIPDEDANNVATACDHVVALPWGFEKRVASCPECLALVGAEGSS
jgi:hypothetical protein